MATLNQIINRIQGLRRSVGRIALNLNSPFLAKLFCLGATDLKTHIVSPEKIYPADIQRNMKVLLKMPLDLIKWTFQDEQYRKEDMNTLFLLLLSSSLYNGSEKSPTYNVLAEDSKKSVTRSLIRSIETPTALIENEVSLLGVTHLFLWFEYNNSERILALLSALRVHRKLSVSVYIPDPHSYDSFDAVIRCIEAADFFYMGSTWAPPATSRLFDGKIFYRSFAPFVTNYQKITADIRDIDISFSGLEKVARLPCLIALSTICKQRRARMLINLMAGASPVPTSEKNYREVLFRSFAVLNISLRDRDINEIFDVLNARVFEVMATGALLVEFKPPQISTLSLERYFTEGEHFVTFSDFKSLDALIERIVQRDPSLVQIAKNGHETYLQLFNNKNLVDELFYDFSRVRNLPLNLTD